MPRNANTAKKQADPIDADDNAPDGGAAAQQRILRTPAGAPVTRPPGAAASVFDLAKRAAPGQTKRHYTAPFDPTLVPISKGVALPESKSGREDRCKVLLDRMVAGDSVVLTHIQAKSIKAAGKRFGIELTVRRLNESESGVWRLA